MQSEEVWMSMKVLQEHGWSIAAMAREFGLNWRTVKRTLERQVAPRYGPRRRPFALNEVQLVHVERRLEVCPSIRGTDLHAELRHDYGYQGSYPKLPTLPTLADYDALGRRWIEEIVLKRRHRTTRRVVGEAWQEERALLRPIPERILASFGSPVIVAMPANVIDLELRRLGEHVDVRDLAEYEVGR